MYTMDFLSEINNLILSLSYLINNLELLSYKWLYIPHGQLYFWLQQLQFFLVRMG